VLCYDANGRVRRLVILYFVTACHLQGLNRFTKMRCHPKHSQMTLARHEIPQRSLLAGSAFLVHPSPIPLGWVQVGRHVPYEPGVFIVTTIKLLEKFSEKVAVFFA